MFKTPIPVNPELYPNLMLDTTAGYGFAKEQMSVPVLVPEFVMAAKNYPIVFVGAQAVAVVLMGKKEGENVFINDKGEWKEGHYIPAHIRRYPFAFVDDTENERLVLTIDESAPHCNQGIKGERLFDDNKQPTPIVANALQFLSSLQNDAKINEALSKDLLANNLLTYKQITFTLPNGENAILDGLGVIDEEKFNKLSAKVFNEFRQKGWLAPIYFHLQSLTNFDKLS